MKTSVEIIVAVIILIIAATSAGAASPSTCNISATPVSFGGYDVASMIPLDSTGTVSVTCSANTNLMISIGASPNSGGFNPRKMKHLSRQELVDYNLFTTAARTVIWGDGTQGTSSIEGSARKGQPLALTVYGRIPAGQDPYVGDYGDNLTVTIIW